MAKKELKDLEFDLELKEIKVKLKNTDGSIRNCILREVTGTKRDSYLNFMGGKIKTNSEGKSAGLKDFNNLQSRLISDHLLDADSQANLTCEEVNNYPASVMAELAKTCRQISGLDEDSEEDETKNS